MNGTWSPPEQTVREAAFKQPGRALYEAFGSFHPGGSLVPPLMAG
jgi:hypothetical protein